jgi:hypothetical protein
MGLLGATMRPLTYRTTDSTERHHGEEDFLPITGGQRALDQHGVTTGRPLPDTDHGGVGFSVQA